MTARHAILFPAILAAAVLALATPAPGGEFDSLKISVERDRIYRATGAEIAAQGIDLAGLRAERLNVLREGKPIPIAIEGAGPGGEILPETRIVFWGEYPRGGKARRNIHTRSNPHVLVFESDDPPARIRAAEPAAADPAAPFATTHRATWHAEQDWFIKYYQHYPGLPTDRAIWASFKSPPKKGGSVEFNPPPDPADPNGTARTRVLMWGNSYLRENPDHIWDVSVNEAPIGRASWDGNEHILFEADAPISAFRDSGENRMRFANGHESELIDAVSLDWIEFEYDAKLTPRRDVLQYTLPAEARQVRIAPGFSADPVRVWDVDGGVAFDLRRAADGSVEYAYDFEGEPRRFVAFVPGAEAEPEGFLAGRPSRLRELADPPEYVVLTHAKFASAAASLVAHRESQGLRSLLVDVEDVYDEYADGIFSPRAIRDFANDLIAKSEGKERPFRYLFLVGDANYDYLNVRKGAPNYVPTFHSDEDAVTTDYAPIYSRDDWFVYGADDSPDPLVAVGRLPCREPGELLQYVSKIVEFESVAAAEPWTRRGMLIAAEGFDGYTKGLSEKAEGWDFREIYAKTGDVEGNAGMKDRIVEGVDEGVAYVYFIGHGAEFMWRTGSFDPKEQTDMFTDAEIDRLTNRGKYPVVFASTCFSALFDTPGHSKSGVGVALVEAGGRGAIACVAHVGKAPVNAGHQFASTMIGGLFHGEGETRHERIGDAFLEAKHKYRGQLVSSIALIGDPALRFGDRYLPAGSSEAAAAAEAPPAPEAEGAPMLAEDAHRVRLTWKTETETNSFGYFVWRADEEGAEPVRINADAPLDGAGTTTTPHRYVYFDLAVEPDRTYYYKVQQMDLDGTTSWIIGGEAPVPAKPKPLKPEEREEIATKGTSYSEEAL